MSSPAFPIRMWEYQAERFPLVKTLVLTGAFSAASVTASALLGDRSVPGVAIYLVAWLSSVCVMFQLRVLDEHKDNEDDARYRPERPVPRGLVTLAELRACGYASVAIPALALTWLDWRLPLVYGVVLAFMALMTVHFFVPQDRTVVPDEDVLVGGKLVQGHRPDLKGNSIFTLISHMLVMPLVDLLVTACEWLPTVGHPPSGLWIFLGLSFANGCVVELGRKVWAPVSERLGVDTYSARWGHTGASLALVAASFASFSLVAHLGGHVGFPPLWVAGLVAIVPVCVSVAAFQWHPWPFTQRWVENASGLFVFMTYASAGFLPLAFRGLA